MTLAVVDVDGAVFSRVTVRAVARKVRRVIDASAAIGARIIGQSSRAEGDLGLADMPRIALGALAIVASDLVDAAPVVLALVLQAVVNVRLATDPFVTERTIASENRGEK